MFSKEALSLVAMIFKFFCLQMVLSHWIACIWRIIGESAASDVPGVYEGAGAIDYTESEWKLSSRCVRHGLD